MLIGHVNWNVKSETIFMCISDATQLCYLERTDTNTRRIIRFSFRQHARKVSLSRVAMV